MTLRLPEWRTRAACRGRFDLDFVEPGEQLAECLALCAACPVAEQCLAEALDAGEAWGIWGGLDAERREQLAEQTGHPAPAVRPAHGTNSRYAKHGCRCDLCREAHTAYDRQRRARNRARVGDPWVRPIVLAERVRTGHTWAGPGQLLLPLPGVPLPVDVEHQDDQQPGVETIKAA
ncbi:hypothetical protein GCM10022243_64140 [Saccharothrix violaceirubra]|uniref:Transcriptional regulator WhiB n=1 Tax=Saccharothrix violaceirubra TaxID=413306 RepID=A0A7W7T9T3_9PSEU|nr:WhiB family transcriptional regulator [Saccharothrix violaceirubra]MBB4969101.1 hypothetical protein [Saccharothrix violaceirubra]